MLFNKNVDWLLIALPTAIAIYLFYGSVAGGICFLLIAAIVYAKPVDSFFTSYWARIVFAASIVLLLSPILRAAFPQTFCEGAPLSPNGGIRESVTSLPGDVLGVGGYIQGHLVDYCLNNLWSQADANGGSGWPRDYVYPVVGAIGLVLSLLKRDRQVSL